MTSSAFEVKLARTWTVVQVPADRSIVEVLHSSGVEVATSCGEGICGTCEVAVLAETPDHRDQLISEEERTGGRTMMPCVSRGPSPRLVLEL